MYFTSSYFDGRNIAEHTAIVIMASTASSVAIAMEIIAAIGTLIRGGQNVPILTTMWTDLFYDEKLNAAVAIFQIFASQMLGYGMAGIRTFLLPMALGDALKIFV